MHTINIDSANKQFSGEIKVGEYVAFWLSDDRQDSMVMTSGSFKTAEEAEADAANEGEKVGIDGGYYEASMVVDSE